MEATPAEKMDHEEDRGDEGKKKKMRLGKRGSQDGDDEQSNKIMCPIT